MKKSDLVDENQPKNGSVEELLKEQRKIIELQQKKILELKANQEKYQRIEAKIKKITEKDFDNLENFITTTMSENKKLQNYAFTYRKKLKQLEEANKKKAEQTENAISIPESDEYFIFHLKERPPPSPAALVCFFYSSVVISALILMSSFKQQLETPNKTEDNQQIAILKEELAKAEKKASRFREVIPCFLYISNTKN